MTMTGLAMKGAQSIARPLKVLVPLIKEDLQQGNEAATRASEPYYRAAGEKMIEAKASPEMKHGQFGPWLRKNFDISPAHAARYMSFARATAGKQNSRFENFSDFMRKEGGDPGYGRVVRRQEWHEPVKATIEQARRDAERVREQDLSRARERDEERKLGLRLIDIGWKILAKELHTDRGGSKDAIQRLNRVRDRLKASV